MKKVNFQDLVARELYTEALSLYARCHASAVHPTSFTFPFLLKACGKLRSAPEAEQLHAHIVKAGFQSDVYTATALTDAYMKLDLTGDALKVFERIPSRNVPSFNAVISGFCQNGCFHESLRVFGHLQWEGFLPSSVTVAGVLPACGSVEQGSQFHGLSVKLGFELNDFVATSLVSMYSNCGELSLARRVFELVPEKKIVSFNAMISGFSRNGFFSEAFHLFKEMLACSAEVPNSSTLVSLLSSCSDLSILPLGKQIHCYYLKRKSDKGAMVGTAFVDMYSKCGGWRYAYRVFTSLGQKDLITWNAMISGLLLHGRSVKALELFQQLEIEGLQPDATTWNLMISDFSRRGNATEAFRFFNMMLSSRQASNRSLKSITSLLQACSTISDLQHGKEIHGYAVRAGMAYEDDFFLTALVDMYMKCGYSLHARRVFNKIARRPDDVALWNAMISGYGRNGESESALEFFSLMRQNNIKPDLATFLSIISVCSHAGYVQQGYELFRMMSNVYGLNPKAEHFSCMVDLLGRSGKLNEAWDLLQEIPKPLTSMYYSLLGAAMCYADAELGAVMAERLSELDPGNPGPLVILSNIYADKGRWDYVECLRDMFVQKRLKKYPGFSRIQMTKETNLA
uniref:Pentatricopeptide repeat-containing protein At2g02750 n=1 Tax=Anthurium amnicola TaxID=1678845 RepID=A0A1D1XH20_9ARAE